MKFATPQTIEGIARILNCEYIGNAEFPVFGMNEIHVVASGDIVFVDHPKYYDKALTSKATIILIICQDSGGGEYGGSRDEAFRQRRHQASPDFRLGAQDRSIGRSGQAPRRLREEREQDREDRHAAEGGEG